MSKLKIGITGGIGSGKSYCARYFRWLGIPFYDADARAKILMTQDPTVREHLIRLLGKNVFLDEGNLNRPFMRDQLFNDPDIRLAVNAIVHPAVGRDYENWHSRQTAPFTLKEAALLVESGSYKTLDHLISVTVPLPVRIQRVMHRDRISSEAVRQRIKSQWPEEEKHKVSDSFIDNSGVRPLLPQIIQHYIVFLNS